jgi:trigger factor
MPAHEEEIGLSGFERVAIELPPEPTITSDDVDAELFGYVASAPKGSTITSISDLDDAWATQTFDGLSSIGELRASIQGRLEQEGRYAYETLKYQRCADALIARLTGEIDDGLVAGSIEQVRAQKAAAIHASGVSLSHYLKEEGITEEEYAFKVEEETRYSIALNQALDTLATVTGVTVANHELTNYLVCDAPQAFVEELLEKGAIEEARTAAVRVKLMRRVMETADITTTE